METEKQPILKIILHGIAVFLPHLLMTYALMLLTFFVITIFNESMQFLSSTTSRHFEVVYVVAALLTVAAALVQKRVRIPAIVTAACTVIFAIPVFIALAEHSPIRLETTGFRVLALIYSLVTLVFSIMLIVSQRRAKRALAATE